MGMEGMQTGGHGRRLCETQAQTCGDKQCWWRGRLAWAGALQGGNHKEKEEEEEVHEDKTERVRGVWRKKQEAPREGRVCADR